MTIFESTLAPYMVLLVIFAVLAGFFRKLLVKVVLIILVQLVLLALFPQLLVALVNAVTAINNAF